VTPQAVFVTLAAMALLVAASVPSGTPFAFVGSAHADDDDGGGDDSDDDGGGGGGGGGGSADDDDDDGPGASRPSARDRVLSPTRRPTAPAVAPSQAAPVQRPLFARNEIVVLDLEDAGLARLFAQGFRLIEERPVPSIGQTARRLAVPPDVTLEAARETVRGLAPGGEADFNHFYRSEADETATCDGPHCAARSLIGWPEGVLAPLSCGASVPIGVIDTGINASHEALVSGRIEVHRLVEDDSLDPSRAIHGTAVAALLVGAADSRTPGLLPEAQLIAVDAFHTSAGDERADVFALVEAMDFLAGRGTRVLNLSLAGPPNAVLEEAIARLAAAGVVVVAAAGNGGPRAEPAYPAAYPTVIAVTAVDRSGAIYRRAGRGDHIDIAAPGVEVWTAASVRGARPKTGTSFAAPFVSAAAALLLGAEPNLAPADVRLRLKAAAQDLGETGEDPVFGAGLVQATGLCSSQ
jgi:minor extracellular protease Epr